MSYNIRFVYQIRSISGVKGEVQVISDIEEIYINVSSDIIQIKPLDRPAMNFRVSDLRWFHCCFDLECLTLKDGAELVVKRNGIGYRKTAANRSDNGPLSSNP